MSKSVAVSVSLTVALSVLFVLAVQFSVAAPLAGEVTVCTWLGCKPGAVSYTQDDASNVAGSNSCRTHLEAAGFRGTFFYDGTEPEPWMATYTAAGHEVGSHLASHLQNYYEPSCGDSCTLESLRLPAPNQTLVDNFRQEQIDPSVSAIESATGQPVLSMAYPYGATDSDRMAASDLYFLSARGYLNYDVANFPWITGVNSATPTDTMLLNSHDSSFMTLVQQAIDESKWAVLTMHDYCFGIGEDGNYLADNAAALWVAPVGEVMKYIKVRDAARFDNYIETTNSISFDAGHSLSTLTRQTYTGTALLPIVFDNSVTLNVAVPANKAVGAVLIDGLPAGYITRTNSVLITASLEITRHVAITLTTPTSVPLPAFDAQSNSELGQNLGWLVAMIVMGISGFIGLMKANRRQVHPLDTSRHKRRIGQTHRPV